MSAVLALRGVTKRYQWRGPWVLSGADLALEPGSFVSITGENGSGKSTLLRIAAGVSAPSGGVVEVPKQVGFVPERQAGRGRFTGAAYLAHMGRVRGLDSEDAETEGAELLTRLGVKPGPLVPWDQLSKGNRQKVVLAQAFLGRLDAVILDEPFSGLDEDARCALADLVSEARAEGTSVMVSSHDIPPGIDKRYRLVQGRLDQDLLAPSSNAAEVRRVEVIPKRVDAALDELTGRAAVVRWEGTPEGSGLVLDVQTAACDELIRTALDLGWSVRSVVPIETRGKD